MTAFVLEILRTYMTLQSVWVEPHLMLKAWRVLEEPLVSVLCSKAKGAGKDSHGGSSNSTDEFINKILIMWKHL